MCWKLSLNTGEKSVSESVNLRVVLDSNVLISVFLAQNRTLLSTELYRKCLLSDMLYTAEEILAETRRVLLERERIRRSHPYSDEQVERFIGFVREDSTVVTNLPTLRVVERDPDDDMIIACAVVADADYIVSRDRDLLDLGEYAGIEIVAPETFIHRLRNSDL